MVVDVGIVRKYIKPKADITLYNMRKVDLIEYIRTLEHNYNVAVSFNENQAKYIESLGFKGVVMCKVCDWYRKHEGGICVNPKCGKSWYGCPVPAEHFCSYGERREGE